MTAERQAQPLVIGHDIGALGRGRQLDPRLRKARRLQHLRTPRLDAERFPAGLMAVAGERGQRSTGGERFELE